MENNINIERSDFYMYDCGHEQREKTKKRLTRIAEIGMTEVMTAEFGIKGIVSGLYVERVWIMSDEDFDGYMEWVQQLIDREKLKTDAS